MVESGYRSQIHDPFVIGIDLGTTNSVAAIMKKNIPVVISNNGERSTPSIVKLGEPEIIGNDAKKYLIKEPLSTIFASKRLMGRKFKDPEIQEYIKSLPYKTTQSCNGDIWIKTSFGKFAPSQIGAKILSKIKLMAEKSIGNSIKRAVITVPAYFNDSQRQATKEACRIAGLDVIRVINEPTAAALAYGLDKNAAGNIAVYDLGGGTFDISILEVDNGVFHVKATNGDTFLGGEDFDNEFMKFIINLYETKEGIRLNSKEINMEKLKMAAEKAKIDLSNKMSTEVFVENIVEGRDIEMLVSRDQLENVVRKVAMKTIKPCEQAIRDAKIDKSDIKHVVLVGGMTKMPLIRKIVKDIFEIEPLTDVNPDEIVAQGAAIQAGILCGDIDNVILLDVIPLSLGIETLGGVFSKIINRNTTLPFKQTETFSTSNDNQNEVDINIYQGERPLVKDNKCLGTIKLINIPPAPRGVPKINVTFESDENGLLKVGAVDNLSKKKQELTIIPFSGLTEEEIRDIVKEAEEKRELDRENSLKVEIKLKSKDLIEQLEGKRNLSDKVKRVLKDLERMVSNEGVNSKDLESQYNILKNYV